MTGNREGVIKKWKEYFEDLLNTYGSNNDKSGAITWCRKTSHPPVHEVFAPVQAPVDDDIQRTNIMNKPNSITTVIQIKQ